jgi:Domain of Unknown Function (DUF748)
VTETDIGGPERGGRPRWRRRAALILAGLVALGLGLRLVLPYAIARGIEYGVRRTLGLPARVTNVDLSLLAGGAAVEGLVVGAHPDQVLDPETALVGWGRFYADLAWGDLLRHRLHLRELVLAGPAIHLERAPDGSVDLSFLPAPEPGEEEAPTEPSEPWPVQVDQLSLSDVRFDIMDRATGTRPLAFSLEQLSIGDIRLGEGHLSLGAIGIRSPALQVSRAFVLGAGGTGAGATPPEATAGEVPAARTAAAPASEPVAAPPAPPAPAEPGPVASAKPEPAPAPPPPEPGMRYGIDHVQVEAASFTLAAGDVKLDVTLGLEASNVALGPELFPIQLRLELRDGSLSLDGKLALEPVAFEGHLHWQDLPLPPLTVATNPEIAAWVRSCRAGGDVDLALRTEPGPKGEPAGIFIRNGTTSVDDLEIANPGEEPEVAVGWKSLSIDVHEVFLSLGSLGTSEAPIRVALDQVRLVSPHLRYTNPAPALDALLGGTAAAGESGEAPVAPAADEDTARKGEPSIDPIELRIGRLEISGGDLEYDDRSVSPSYRAHLRDLALVGKDLQWPGPRVRDLDLRARSPQGSSFAVTGGLDGRNADLRLEVERVALPPLNPYAVPAGYRLERGTVSLESKLRVRGDRYEAGNQIVLDKLGIGAIDPGDFQERFGMPLDLALALLRSPSGKISLSIPVVVDAAKGTDVALGPIVSSALRQALIGAATSPLKMVGAAVSKAKGGGLSVDPLPFAPGKAELEGDAADRLAPLANLLAARPGLAIALRGRAGPADVPVVAEQILTERATAGDDLPEVAEAGFFAKRRVVDALRHRAQGEPSELSAEDAALLARYVAAVQVPDVRLQDLARQRAEAVRARLLRDYEADADAVSLGDPADPGPPAVLLELGSRPS